MPSASESPKEFFVAQLDNFRRSFPDYVLSEGPNSINLSGNPALEAKFVFEVDNIKYKTMEIWIINQDRSRAYQIETTVKVDKFPSFPPEHIQRMIDSLKI